MPLRSPALILFCAARAPVRHAAHPLSKGCAPSRHQKTFLREVELPASNSRLELVLCAAAAAYTNKGSYFTQVMPPPLYMRSHIIYVYIRTPVFVFEQRVIYLFYQATSNAGVILLLIMGSERERERAAGGKNFCFARLYSFCCCCSHILKRMPPHPFASALGIVFCVFGKEFCVLVL